jgi:hypothetical protein
MQAIAHFVLHPQAHRTALGQVQPLQALRQLLPEFKRGGGVVFFVNRARNPQPRPGFSQAVVKTAQGHRDAVGFPEPVPHLRHRAPAAFFESRFQLGFGGGREFARLPGVLRPPISQESLDPAGAIGIKPGLNGGTSPARGLGDLIQGKLALQSQLESLQTFPPPARRLGFQDRGHFRALPQFIELVSSSCHDHDDPPSHLSCQSLYTDI